MQVIITGSGEKFRADKMKVRKGIAYFYKRNGFMTVKFFACRVDRVYSVVYDQ